ncbi:MAG: hypothetical protein K8S15_01540 [Candidatus Aegiribacteria sp.]|nr:hypothetical protein [Candidatus Aegiribacteria sp.]
MVSCFQLWFEESKTGGSLVAASEHTKRKSKSGSERLRNNPRSGQSGINTGIKAVPPLPGWIAHADFRSKININGRAYCRGRECQYHGPFQF